MKKQEIITFFDELAEAWDKEAEKNPEKIHKILDFAGVKKGSTVLDVGCGTGILIPDYLQRDVKKCVAVDISPKMIAEAKKKFRQYENVQIVCGDAEVLQLQEPVDCIVIYNAFPHFTDPQLLFQNLSRQLVEEGRLTVAHGMSREDLIRHHSGRAEKVSRILPDLTGMKRMMQPYFEADVAVSDDDIYIVSGILRKKKGA